MKRKLYYILMGLWFAASLWGGYHNLHQQGWVWSACLCVLTFVVLECYVLD